MHIKFTDRFWAPRIKRLAEEVIPYQWKALNDQLPGAEPSHAIENFRIAAGESDGTFHGMVFQDSDVAKWIEAASYSLRHHPNPELEGVIDSVIDLIGRAQQKDGYLNTYFTVVAPDRRWKDQSFGHELYCAGHLMEAAVAYYEVTGKRKLLDIMYNYADLIVQTIGPNSDQLRIYDGHEEIELALVRLYEATNDERYLKLSKFFVDERGQQPSFLEQEPTFGGEAKDRWFQLDYHQAHAPVREQVVAEGHAVRAMYLYSAMADLALLTGDDSLTQALFRLWENVTSKRMYVTGGIGSQAHGERFTIDYDLPNDTAYTETCAAIGLVMWASRMLKLDPKGEYADVMERALYNGVLSGISYDGTRYFYVNPLEVHPDTAKYRIDMKHVETERVPWFGCACCPPNIARIISSLDRYLYTLADEKLFVHLYAGNRCCFEIKGRRVQMDTVTDYPWNGKVMIRLTIDEPTQFGLYLRKPSWAKNARLSINGDSVYIGEQEDRGYIKLTRVWKQDDEICLDLPMTVQRIASHPKVRENAGKIALQRGPMVYCFEEIDNGDDLADLRLSETAELKAVYKKEILDGVVLIQSEGYRSDLTAWEGKLYGEAEGSKIKTEISAVPYAYWGNRQPGEMLVWIRNEN